MRIIHLNLKKMLVCTLKLYFETFIDDTPKRFTEFSQKSSVPSFIPKLLPHFRRKVRILYIQNQGKLGNY